MLCVWGGGGVLAWVQVVTRERGVAKGGMGHSKGGGVMAKGEGCGQGKGVLARGYG